MSISKSSNSSIRPKSLAQNRKIWGTASQLGLPEEHLRDLVYAVTGSRSISGLSHHDASLVIQELEHLLSERRRQHKRIGPPSARANRGQLKYIYDLVKQVEQFNSIWDFRAWLKHWFRVQHEDWLNNRDAVKVITALKAMVTRQQRAHH